MPRPAFPALLLLALPLAPALAAPTGTARVDAKGVMNVPAATLKRLAIRVERNGMVAVQFPPVVPPPPKPAPRPRTPLRKPSTGAPIHPRPQGSIHLPDPVQRIKLWVTLRADGSLRIPSQRVARGVSVPGAPGTVYRLRGIGGKLVLERLSSPGAP